MQDRWPAGRGHVALMFWVSSQKNTHKLGLVAAVCLAQSCQSCEHHMCEENCQKLLPMSSPVSPVSVLSLVTISLAATPPRSPPRSAGSRKWLELCSAVVGLALPAAGERAEEVCVVESTSAATCPGSTSAVIEAAFLCRLCPCTHLRPSWMICQVLA